MRRISFVIPCYNSEHTIRTVIEEIEQTVLTDDKYEIILVDDCSRDCTWNIIRKLAEDNSNIVGIGFSKNFGQHAALMAGYRKAKGDIIVSLDDDGQIPVDEVYKLIEKLEEGYDAVYAKYHNKKHNLGRNLGSKFASWMSRIMLNRPKDVTGSSYFVMRRYVMEEVLRYENCYPYIFGLVLRATNNITNVCVEHRKRVAGNSGYTMGKLVRLWLNGYTSFSVKPLRVAGILGYVLAVLGFVYVGIIVIRKLLNPNMIVGWSSVMGAILIIGGIILIMFGVMGEYIGRIYICLNNSPQYVIKESVDQRDKFSEIMK